jgi:hypothetical protein
VAELVVVVREEPVVDRSEFGPAWGRRVVVVGHAAHDVEMGLDGVLPGLPGVDLLLADAEVRVDGLGVLRLENATAIADEDLRCPVGLDRRPQDDEVGRQVLPGRDRARQQCPAEVLQDRDRRDRFAGAELVVVEVADVDRPHLVAPPGGERHRLRLVGNGRRGLRRAQGAMQRQDPPAGARAEVDPLLGEGGVDAELAQLGAGLQPPGTFPPARWSS